MSAIVSISGILVRARPERAAEVARALGALPGVDVRAVLDRGRIVLVAEEAAGRVGETLTAAADVDGVITATLVYHHETADPDAFLNMDPSEPSSAPDARCTKEVQP